MNDRAGNEPRPLIPPEKPSSPLDWVDQLCDLPPEERRRRLDEAGLSGEEREKVEKWLGAAGGASEFLAHAQVMPDYESVSMIQERPGTVIGNYKLLQQIGEGGFGTVFMAEQERPIRRRVGLKIIKLGMDTREVIARFEAERQALAMMDHPNIARVFEAGATASGRPYFAMELVRGIPITEYCDINRLSTAQRLDLFVTVCHAIQHAHQKGVIHRDIKPNNILVTSLDGAPLAKVIDFGIAKATTQRLTEKTLFTRFHQFIGTPAYVSPEQAEMSGLDIDTRSDIYSLGVLLYELLTGTTPFNPREVAFDEIQRVIREVEPPKPSTRLRTVGDTLSKLASNRRVDPRKLADQLRGDLDLIIMKAMDKDRTRRYQTCDELAREIRRHLNSEPIEASAPSTSYLLRRFVRRHRAAVLTAAVFMLTIAAATTLFIHGILTQQRKTLAALGEAQEQRRQANLQHDEALQAKAQAVAAQRQANIDFVRAAVAQGHSAASSNRSGRRFDSLKLLAAAAKISPTADVRSQAMACLALADMRITRQWRGSDYAVFNHACTACADQDATSVLIRDVPQADSDAGALRARLPGRAWNYRIDFSPDDQLVAVCHEDNHIRLFNLTGQLVLDFSDSRGCDFTPDGSGIAVRKIDGPVILYDLPSGKERQRFSFPQGSALAFSPDGRKLALWDIYGSTSVAVGDLASGKVTLLGHPNLVLRLDWHPTSGVLATVIDSSNSIYLWNLAAGSDQPERILSTQSTEFDVKFSHGGDLVATSSWDGTTRLWNAVSGELLVRVFADGLLRFSPDDRTLALASMGGKHSLVEVEPGRECRRLPIPSGRLNRQAVFSHDDRLLASCGHDIVRFWNIDSPDSLPPVDLPIGERARNVRFAPDGSAVYFSADSGLLRAPIIRRITPAADSHSKPVQRVSIGSREKVFFHPVAHDGNIQISADGMLAIAQYTTNPLVFDLRRPQRPIELPEPRTFFIDLSADGKWVATGTWRGSGQQRVAVWDAHTGKREALLAVPLDANVAFSPDNRWLVTASGSEFRFWEVGTWRPGRQFAAEYEFHGLMAFSGDSRTLALSTNHYGMRLVDVETGTELATLEDDGDLRPLAFSHDSGLLATLGNAATFRLWDLRRIRQELAEMGLDWPQPPLPLRPKVPPLELIPLSSSRP